MQWCRLGQIGRLSQCWCIWCCYIGAKRSLHSPSWGKTSWYILRLLNIQTNHRRNNLASKVDLAMRWRISTYFCNIWSSCSEFHGWIVKFLLWVGEEDRSTTLQHLISACSFGWTQDFSLRGDKVPTGRYALYKLNWDFLFSSLKLRFLNRIRWA